MGFVGVGCKYTQRDDLGSLALVLGLQSTYDRLALGDARRAGHRVVAHSRRHGRLGSGGGSRCVSRMRRTTGRRRLCLGRCGRPLGGQQRRQSVSTHQRRTLTYLFLITDCLAMWLMFGIDGTSLPVRAGHGVKNLG